MHRHAGCRLASRPRVLMCNVAIWIAVILGVAAMVIVAFWVGAHIYEWIRYLTCYVRLLLGAECLVPIP